MVTERFASRCPVLASRLSNQIIADVTVYSILNVRNGWIHFLEFYYAHHAKPSELCGQSAIIVDKLSRWGQSQRELMSPAENAEVIWENLPQVAAILTLIPRLAEMMRGKGHLKDADMLSLGQRNIITRKAFDLWALVLPRLHLINWEQMKSLLLQNANYGQGISISEKAIFCYVIAEAPHLRFLVLQNTLVYLQSAQQSNESHASLIGNAMKVLEVLRIGVRPSPTTSPTSPRLSSSPPTSATAYGLYPGIVSRITEAKDFVGDVRCVEAQIPREVLQLCTLDVLSKVLSEELSGARCFKSASLLVEMMVIVASTIMQLQNSSTDGESLPDVLKTLQIMASTDLTFFHDCDQLQELATLWQLHRESHSSFCDSSLLEREIQFQNSAFVDRWMYVIENHGVEFNPFLIQKDATIQASMLGEEMLAAEMLWQEVLDDASAATAAALEAEGEEEGRLTVLKQEAEKFAGSVHKLILHTIRETSPADDTTENLRSDVAQETGETNKADNVGFMEGYLWKVDSKENAYRMRLRLKRVKENYRLRNLSCEFAGSSLQDEDQKGGRSGPRRFKSARDSIGGGAVIDIDRSWRSDAGSDYSDFFADAQMRAAIIRSCPSVGGRDSFAGELSDEDEDLDDVDDAHVYDSDEDATFEEEAQAILSEELHAMDTAPIEEKPLEEFLGSSDDLRAPSSPPTSQSDTLNQAPKAKAESPKSPLLGGFGASVLSGLSGVAELVQKAAKDAKEAMEYGVDSLYTARDALTDETQSLVQEVSTLIDSSKPPASSKTANHVESGLSPTSADCRRLSISIADPSSDANPQLFPSSPPQVHSRHRAGEGKPARRGSGSSKRELSFEASLVRHMNVVGGKLVLTGPYLYFIAERVIDEHENVLAERKKGVPIESAWRFLFKRRRWLIDDVSSLYRRRYLLKPTAIEIFIHSTRKNYFFSMSMDDLTRFHEALMMRRPMLLRRDPTMRRLRHPSNIFRNSTMSVRWMNHEISTFEYLMWLNTTAGRTYNDLTQYPVFPWVIADYESSSLDLSRASTFRDLSRPIGALEPTRLKFFLDRYNSFEDSDIPKFLYGTHYSNIGVVLYYLIRLEPFTSYALSVQGGKFDHADRLFQSVADTWQNCLHDFNDLKELTPEWYYLPDFLKNCNGLDLGVKQNGVVLGDVVLPPWAKSAEDFVIKNLTALESEYASANIHRWIDLVFGYNQRGPAAIAANNVFFYLTYEGMVDIDSITDPIIKSSMRAQIAHFGQTPTQVLRDPHPARSQLLTKKSSPSGPLMASPPERAASPLSKATVSSDGGRSTLLFLPHDYPITLLHLAPGASSMLCADNHGQVSVHRYGGKSVKVHHTPFLNDLSSTATKASGVFKTPKQAASSSSFVDLPSDLPADYIELHDRKSRKVIAGDKILTAAQYSINNSIAFMNAGAVYCTVGHHDFSARFYSSSDGALLYRLLQHHSVVTCLGTSTNGSLLALGSTDGTISVWKVTNIASTLLDSIKIFRGSKSNSRPVHAHDYAADQVLLGHASSINCVALSEDLGVCISGSSSNECFAHNLDDGSIEQQYKVPGTDTPGILSLALSPVGLVLVQSMGTGVPMLYCFHLNGKFMAGVGLGERPMTSLSVCTRYSQVIVSNQEEALTFSAHDLEDKHVLLSKDAYGDIHTHSLSPDETHVVFGVGIAKVISLSLIPNPSQEKS
ncbi:hypothetical protein Poli38472_002383 [Pythium oligandrum]|uniref:Uncharacterized protein n=1 Tax=Pythium oligandrum TaxID=41045 RepID=A0A8K1CHF0_PYTOL|nr:hypothetical protein Poli38472_002383 [Pythium oligandrum]|eukprot:TMW63442.1 hypothetical protein Poli38472_002383 [Pythium oligandrum]